MVLQMCQNATEENCQIVSKHRPYANVEYIRSGKNHGIKTKNTGGKRETEKNQITAIKYI
jgi:hypothetical protein